jgi:hypothetical protein
MFPLTDSDLLNFDDLYALTNGEGPYHRSHIICYYKDDKLFESEIKMREGVIKIESNLDKENRNRVLSSIDRAGVRTPYRCELYLSAESQQTPKYKLLGVKYFDLDAKPDNFYTFDEWFLNWINGRIVVPDTCIIYHHYLSEVILPRISKNIKIKIPRFVIFELESIANRENKKSKYKGEDKRLAFSAFNEIRKLRTDASAIPLSKSIDGNLLADFSRISGERRADGFIRLEMLNEMYSNTTTIQKPMVLLTKDMVMACTASAEDIDTFYFCPAKPDKKEFYINSNQLASIIYETAITFNEIRIDEKFKDKSLNIKGMWSGKDIMDWGYKRLKIK